MIAKLTGLVDTIGDGWAVVDVGGVGYLVLCARRVLDRLIPGEAVSLVIETHVREDAIQLFGFLDRGEQEWFRLLTGVQGVGAKAALAVLTALDPPALAQAVAAGDRSAITRAAGVGPKLAARIIAELREAAQSATFATRATRADGIDPGIGPAADAVAALIGLGFRQTEAFTAVGQAAARLGGNAELEALIRGGLAELRPREHR